VGRNGREIERGEVEEEKFMVVLTGKQILQLHYQPEI